jgi:23S rRNA (cytosine1962-C5)-methyltransferase
MSLTVEAFSALPPIPEGRLRLEVHKQAERAIRDGHPWVFDQSITKQNRDGVAGQLAVIFDQKNRFLAVGLYDPDSVIRVKILHAGTPTPIDSAFYHEKIEFAVARRVGLAATDTNGYRLIHGENDGFPSLILDRYAETFVLKLYSAAWLPHLRDVLTALWQVHAPERLVLRLSRQLASASTYGFTDGQVLVGSVPEGDVFFRENGLTFSADVIHGHKTGFFFDQRDNRYSVREFANGADVLDVFAYSGGFSVSAAAGGAKSVLSVDISEPE